ERAEAERHGEQQETPGAPGEHDGEIVEGSLGPLGARCDAKHDQAADQERRSEDAERKAEGGGPILPGVAEQLERDHGSLGGRVGKWAGGDRSRECYQLLRRSRDIDAGNEKRAPRAYSLKYQELGEAMKPLRHLSTL